MGPNYRFLFYAKNSILSKDHVPWKYFLYFSFWLVICIAKNLIWTTLKAILSLSLSIYIYIFFFFFFFAPSDSRFSNSCISAKYCPILRNHTSMESFQMMYKISVLKKMTLMTGFVVQGHRLKDKMRVTISLSDRLTRASRGQIDWLIDWWLIDSCLKSQQLYNILWIYLILYLYIYFVVVIQVSSKSLYVYFNIFCQVSIFKYMKIYFLPGNDYK